MTLVENDSVIELIDHDGMRLQEHGKILGKYQYWQFHNPEHLARVLAERRNRKLRARANRNSNQREIRNVVIEEEDYATIVT